MISGQGRLVITVEPCGSGRISVVSRRDERNQTCRGAIQVKDPGSDAQDDLALPRRIGQGPCLYDAYK